MEYANKHSGLITIAAGTAPLIVALVMAVYFTRGDVHLANYIIQEVGIVQLWTSALVLVIVSILQPLLAEVMFDTKAREIASKHIGYVGAIFLGSIAIAVVPLVILIAPILGKITGWIIVKLWRKQAGEFVKKRKNFRRELYATYGAMILFLGVISYPLVPQSLITLKDDSSITGSILTKKDGYYLVQEKNRNLKIIYRDAIKNEKLCSSALNNQWPLTSAASLFRNGQNLTSDCPK